MCNLNEWASTVTKFCNDAKATGTEPIHRENFEKLVDVQSAATWEGFQHLLNTRFRERRWAFRGHADPSWRLETSLERAVLRYVVPFGGQSPIEHYFVDHPNRLESALLYEFQQRAHQYVNNAPSEREVLDWFALMQHHGVPTRLLDWTFSPYVAAYFALESRTSFESCTLWALDVNWVNSEAARQSKASRVQFPECQPDGIPGDRALTTYVNGMLLNEDSPSVVVAVTPSRLNERMAAQNGVFLCDLGSKETFDLTLMRMIDCALIKSSEEPNGESSGVRLFEGCGALEPPICRIDIQKKERGLFLNELYRMNIHGASLFPGLDGFARAIRLRMEMNVDEVYGQIGFADRLRMQRSDGS